MKDWSTYENAKNARLLAERVEARSAELCAFHLDVILELTTRMSSEELGVELASARSALAQWNSAKVATLEAFRVEREAVRAVMELA
jgi:hypothetical protein